MPKTVKSTGKKKAEKSPSSKTKKITKTKTPIKARAVEKNKKVSSKSENKKSPKNKLSTKKNNKSNESKKPQASLAKINLDQETPIQLDLETRELPNPSSEQETHLTDKQLQSIKDILLSEKEKLLGKERSLDQFCLDKNELSDVLDEASINIQASQELRFRNRETFYLKKINKGLDRIQRGTYGLCEDCDGAISFERLLARPTAELCINCKEEAEMSERSNFFEARSKSLGKTMNEMNRRS